MAIVQLTSHCTETVQLLLENNANVNQCNYYDNCMPNDQIVTSTALHAVTCYNPYRTVDEQIETARLLITYGADITALNSHGLTALESLPSKSGPENSESSSKDRVQEKKFHTEMRQLFTNAAAALSSIDLIAVSVEALENHGINQSMEAGQNANETSISEMLPQPCLQSDGTASTASSI